MTRTAYITLIVLIVSAISSCRTPQEVPIRTDSVYIEKLVPVITPPDSATIKALAECDENGRVILKQLDIANSKNIKLQFTLDSLGNIIADIEVPHDTVYGKDKIQYIDKEVPVYIEKELTRWQSFKMSVGDYVIIAIIIVLAIYSYRKLRL